LFFNQELLKEYSSKSVEQKQDVPDSSYIQKIIDFREAHYQQGELYMEFLKVECSKTSSGRQPCTEYKSGGWISPLMSRIPRPVPDATKLLDHHYKDMIPAQAYHALFVWWAVHL